MTARSAPWRSLPGVPRPSPLLACWCRGFRVYYCGAPLRLVPGTTPVTRRVRLRRA